MKEEFGTSVRHFLNSSFDECMNVGDDIGNEIFKSFEQVDSEGSEEMLELSYTNFDFFKFLNEMHTPSPSRSNSNSTSPNSTTSPTSSLGIHSEPLSLSPPERNPHPPKEKSPKKNLDEKKIYPWDEMINKDLPWTVENIAKFQGKTCIQLLQELEQRETLNERNNLMEEENLVEDIPHPPLVEDIPHPPLVEDIPHPPLVEDIPHPPLVEDFPHPPLVEDIPLPSHVEDISPPPFVEDILLPPQDLGPPLLMKKPKLDPNISRTMPRIIDERIKPSENIFTFPELVLPSTSKRSLKPENKQQPKRTPAILPARKHPGPTPTRNIKTLYMKKKKAPKSRKNSKEKIPKSEILKKVPLPPGVARPLPPPSPSNPRWRYHLPGPPAPPPAGAAPLHLPHPSNSFFNGSPVIRPWIPARFPPKSHPGGPQPAFLSHSSAFHKDMNGSLVNCRIICKRPQILPSNSHLSLVASTPHTSSAPSRCSAPPPLSDPLPLPLPESSPSLYRRNQ